MYSQTIYIADNTSENNLPALDMSEIPALPAFQTQKVAEVPASENQMLNIQSVSFIIGAGLITICIFYIVFRYYSHLKNQFPEISISNLLSLRNEKLDSEGQKNEDNDDELQIPSIDVICETDKNNQVEEDTDNFAEEESAFSILNNPLTSIKLSTPKSVEKCIQGFLKITLDK